MFNAPGLPPNDPPTIIVQPDVGVIYTGHKKQEEQGGFAHDDTNVRMLVSNPSFEASTVTSFVETAQAPAILQALGLDPGSLDAVQKEGTPVLPGLNSK